MENELFKLMTRRWIALPFVGTALAGSIFMIVYGALAGMLELVTMGAGALFTGLGVVTGYYFSKRTAEE